MTAVDEMEEITYEQVLRELTELVASVGPDHVYQRYQGSCAYVHPSGPGKPMQAGCLIGQWLHRPPHNIELDWLHQHEGMSVESLLPVLYAEHLMPPVQYKAVQFLSFCQDKQDAYHPWGEVLELGQAHIARQVEVPVEC